MLIGKRAHHPWPDWWIIGGKWNPGLPPEIAAAGKLKDELGLNVNPSRLQFLAYKSFVWEPVVSAGFAGCHDVSRVHILMVSDEEIGQIAPNKEYVETKWVLLEDLARQECGYHPAVQQLARDAMSFLEKL